jgi:hypothetical protein
MADRSGALLHVGLNKSASTWLQQDVFPRLPGFTTVGRGTPVGPDVRRRIEAFGSADDRPGALRELLESSIRADTRLLLSDEGLTSTLRDPSRRAVDAQRLDEELPGSTVLLVIRRQRALLRSSYAQYVQLGGVAPLAAFFSGEPVSRGRPPKRDPVGKVTLWGTPFRFDRRSYDLNELVRLYRDRFGDRLVVELHERITEDPASALKAILRATGSDPASADELANDLAGGTGRHLNVSLESNGLWLLRGVNRARVAARAVWPRSPAVVERLGRAIPGRVRLTAREQERQLLDELASTYDDSNRKLAAASGLDLERYGYF